MKTNKTAKIMNLKLIEMKILHCCLFVVVLMLSHLNIYSNESLNVNLNVNIENSLSKVKQQKMTVNGKIVDRNGEAIIGATIIEENNQSNGTITNIDEIGRAHV